MGKCKKNHEGGLHPHLRQRAVVFSCLLSIPASYIETARHQGVTILSAPVDDAGVAGGWRSPIIVWRWWRCRNRSLAPILA